MAAPVRQRTSVTAETGRFVWRKGRSTTRVAEVRVATVWFACTSARGEKKRGAMAMSSTMSSRT